MSTYQLFFEMVQQALDFMVTDEWSAEQITFYLMGIIDTVKAATKAECDAFTHLQELKEQEHDYQNYLKFIHSLRPVEDKQ